MTYSDTPPLLESPFESPETKLPIAVGIVVQETEELLEDTLRSALELSDRIFVISSESSVSQKCSAETGVFAGNFEESVTFLKSDHDDDESLLRNRLIDHIEAEGKDQWLLWLEPGERFDDSTREELRDFLENGIDLNSIYVMVLHRLVRPDGIRHDLDEETIDPRLMPLGKGLRYQGRLRSTPLPMAETLMIGISAAPGRILCPAKYGNVNLEKRIGERNLRILAEMEKEGEKISEEKLFLRGESYARIGEFATARHCFLRVIGETTQANLRLSAYYGLWETLTLAPIDSNEMTKLLLAGLDHFPIDMQLLTFMGAHLQRLGKLDVAAKTFETAIRYGQISLDVWHRLRIREIAVTSLALLERLRGRPREAIRILETNLESIEDRTEFSRHLMDIYIAERMEEEATQFAATIWGDRELDRIRLAISGACLATGGLWSEAVGPLEQAFAENCRDPLCLRWYCLTLLSLLRFDKAGETLQLWLEVEPDNTEAKSYLFASRHPESFGEIMRTIQNVQLNSLGIAGAELFRKDVAKAQGKERKDHRAIDDAVRDMISSSGTPGKIRCFKPLREPPKAEENDSVETGEKR